MRWRRAFSSNARSSWRLPAGLGEPGRDDDRGADAGAAAFLDDAGHRARRRGDDGEVDARRNLADDAKQGSLHARVLRIDREELAGVFGGDHVETSTAPMEPALSLAPIRATDCGSNSGVR